MKPPEAVRPVVAGRSESQGEHPHERLESQVRSYCRSFPAVFDKAEGCRLYDVDGREYLDFFAGAGALNYGHNAPRISRAMVDYVRGNGVMHSLDMATRAKEAFLSKFESVILRPRKLDYRLQFVGPTGTNGIEAALKLARMVMKRRNVIAFTNSYHGLTAGSLAVTAGESYRNEYYDSAADVTFMPYDGFLGDDVNTVDYARKLILGKSTGVDQPAAIVVETIQAEGGVNVASAAWLRSLDELCRDCGALLIVDDIQVGCGRTGEFFSFELPGIEPDIVVLSKSISGSGQPMSIVLLKPHLDEWEPGQHTSTFRGNNLAFVTATTALEYWESPLFSAEIHRRGQHLAAMLEQLCTSFPNLETRVRGRGMLFGVEIANAAIAQSTSRAAFRRGLVIELCGPEDNVLKVLPPIVTETDDLAAGVRILQQSIAEVAGMTPTREI